ncbi:MAG: hypothetical protein ACK4TA_03145 [Saprospiraceae bacterium]
MKVLRLLVTLSLGFLGIACSTDFEIEADWKDIPVVYGLLSLQDTAHYVRVEKAFLEPSGDATKIAQIADSLYYDAKVQVQLQRVSNGQTFTLQRVDGATEGYPRKDGPFATVPNILYKMPAPAIQLKANEHIRLIINRGETLEPVTAQTTVLGEMTIREPSANTSTLNFGYDRSLTFGWDATPAARFFDLRLILHYEESQAGNPNLFEPKSITWILADDLIREDTTSSRVRFPQGNAVFRGEEFYRFLQANLTPLSDRVRRFVNLDIVITGAGKEVVEQLRITEANTGVTSSQAVPIYSNLSEGRGIFSSKTTVARLSMPLNSASLDSLKNGIYTRNLNFK